MIVAHADPNPTVRGKGFQVLRDAGITVQSGLLEKEAAEQMKPFLHWCEHRRPMVTVKLAIDANGSVDDRSEEAQRFTSEACLDEVHRLRMDCDAILVGAETIERDNPSLTVRRLETERQPLRVILDPKERTNQEATVYTDGYDTIQVGADYNGLLPLLNRLGDMEKQRLLIEGGPKTIHSFLSEELVDEFYLVQSNVVHHEPVPSNIDAQRPQTYPATAFPRPTPPSCVALEDPTWPRMMPRSPKNQPKKQVTPPSIGPSIVAISPIIPRIIAVDAVPFVMGCCITY